MKLSVSVITECPLIGQRMLSFTSLAMRLFVFSLFLLIPVSKAADWSLIGKSTNGHQYFLDTASIEFGTANPSDPSYYQANSKNSIGFWVKTLYKYNKGTPIAAMEKYGGYRIWYTLTRYTASCDTNYLSYEDNVIYGLSHQILDKDYLGTGSRPVPDSIEDHIFNVVCRINRKHLAESEELKFKERAPEQLSTQRADFSFQKHLILVLIMQNYSAESEGIGLLQLKTEIKKL